MEHEKSENQQTNNAVRRISDIMVGFGITVTPISLIIGVEPSVRKESLIVAGIGFTSALVGSVISER